MEGLDHTAYHEGFCESFFIESQPTHFATVATDSLGVQRILELLFRHRLPGKPP